MSWITDCALFEGIVELPGASQLPPAIMALSPVSYWDLRELSGTNLNDQGSAANDGTQSGWVMASHAAPDGFLYPTMGAGDNGGAPDSAGYSVAVTGSLTVGFLLHADAIVSDHAVFSKYNASPNREYQIEFVSDGRFFARILLNTGVNARQRITATGFITTGVWYFIIVRFPSLTGFPTIRVNGSAITGTTSGSGTGGGGTIATVGIGDRLLGSSTAPVRGSMGHVFVINSAISDAACGVLETAAQADGWF